MKTSNTICLLKKLSLLILLLIGNALLFGQSVTYTPSTEIIANPERGLQKYSITSSNYATTPNSNNLSVTTLNNWKTSADKVTVVYRYFLLDASLNSDINTTFLENIQTDFDNVRTAGLKIIVRFSYSNAQGTTAQQPIKSQILTHISQLSSVLNTNKDVIFSLQAGFIGTWGEWYYTNSTEFGTDGAISETQWENRKEIIDAMLAATPTEIPIQVRYAGIKTKMYGNMQLNEQTAYQNTEHARIGFYNDAFLNDYGDQGTYSVSSQCTNPVGTAEYNYIANETKYLPMTGETNGLNACDSGFRTSGSNALNELNLTNWTTINRDYYIPFWTQAINSGHYEEIVKNIGYRFVLNSSSITSNNDNFDLTLDISNVGYARPFKKRNVYLILKNMGTNEVTKVLIDTDIRTWESSVSITQNFDLGLTGTFQLYLWMPDIETNLESNSDYSIQLANQNIWESETGYNNLSQTVSFDSTLSIDDLALENNFSFYPNPASDIITIKLKELDNTEIQIFDVNGQLIKKYLVSDQEGLNISNLSNGLYFICLGKNTSTSVQFIKR
ncbi:T9SS type A sorting domain-containing protein [Aquimarina sp. M1]